MATPDNASDDDKKAIHFDTLLDDSMALLERYSGNVWTYRGESDPGITLLQALTFSSADTGYRHTLPLTDLLVAPAGFAKTQTLDDDVANGAFNETHVLFSNGGENSPASGPVFPKEFRASQVMSCAPVTEDDYRRLILDLNAGEKLAFRNARIKMATTQYQYYYNRKEGQYAFTKNIPARWVNQDVIPLTLTGNLDVTVDVNGTAEDEKLAMEKLKALLNENRPLCGGFNTPQVARAQLVNVLVTLDLNDDATDDDIVRIYTTLYARVTAFFSPQAGRESKPSGTDNLTWFDGPRLDHGQITQLPPAMCTAEKTFSYQPLIAGICSIPGVRQLRSLSHEGNVSKDKAWEIPVRPQCVLRAWNEHTPEAVKSVTFYKKGVKVDFTNYLTRLNSVTAAPPAPAPAGAEDLPALSGRYRHVMDNFSATALLPPVYLEQDTVTGLMNLLEGEITRRRGRLASLPAALSFNRGMTGRGITLPDYIEATNLLFSYETKNTYQSHSDGAQWIWKSQLTPSPGASAQELRSVDYLLRYFGARCEPRVRETDSLADSDDKDYLRVMQGYLTRQADISYSRGRIRVDRISALQQRLAARFGVGSGLFNMQSTDQATQTAMGSLPFYLVENRMLLPEISTENNPLYRAFQKDKIKSTADSIKLTLDPKEVFTQTLVDINLSVNDSAPVFISAVNVAKDASDLTVKLKVTGTVTQLTLTAPPSLVLGSTNVTSENGKINLTVPENSGYVFAVGQLVDLTIYTQSSSGEPGWELKGYYPGQLLREVSGNGTKLTLHVSDSARLEALMATLASPARGTTQYMTLHYSAVGLTAVQYVTGNPGVQRAGVVKFTLESLPPGLTDGAEIQVVPMRSVDVMELTGFVAPEQSSRDEPVAVATVSQVDPVDGTFLASLQKGNWPESGQWTDKRFEVIPKSSNGTDGNQLETELFSSTVSVVLPDSWVKDSNPARRDWIEQVVREEIPAHLTGQIHYLNSLEFKNFSNAYEAWQTSDQLHQGEAFTMLEALSLGHRPPESVRGIGSAVVVSESKANSLKQADVNQREKGYWSYGAFYVAKKAN